MAEPVPPNPRRWEARLSEAAARIEQELRGVVRTVDEEVVPEVRKHSSVALRRVAEHMRSLADTLDDARKRGGDDPGGTTEPTPPSGPRP